MNTPHRSLETVVEMLQVLDLEVIDQHEDLVFVSQNKLIIKFTDDAERLDLYFNEDIEEERAKDIMGQLAALGELHGVTITYKGAYGFIDNEDETMSVEFFDLSDK